MTMIANDITITVGTGQFTANVIDITPPSASRESLKTSYQGTKDATGGFHTFQPATFVDWGECELTIQYNPALSNFALIDGATNTIVITYPDAQTHTFSGFLTGFKPASGGLDTVMTATVTLKVTGEITVG